MVDPATSVLYEVAFGCHYEKIHELLLPRTMDPKFQCFAIVASAEYGHLETLQSLLKNGPVPQDMFREARKDVLQLALINAVVKGQLHVFQVKIKPPSF